MCSLGDLGNLIGIPYIRVKKTHTFLYGTTRRLFTSHNLRKLVQLLGRLKVNQCYWC